MKRKTRKGKKRVCNFCIDGIEKIDYKDVSRLESTLPRGKDNSQKDKRELCPAPEAAYGSNKKSQEHCASALHGRIRELNALFLLPLPNRSVLTTIFLQIV